MTKDDVFVDALLEDPKTAELSPRERAMANYAWKLTKTPGAMAKRDVDALREAGLDDRDIADVNAISAYFNMLNRISNGLGIEGESGLALS